MEEFLSSFYELMPSLDSFDYTQFTDVDPDLIASKVQTHIDLQLLEYMFKHFFVIFLISSLIYMLISFASISRKSV